MSRTIICNVDLKSRRRTIIHTIKNKQNPTCVKQIDDNYLAIGTKGGVVEIWDLESGYLKEIFDTHSESEDGISDIIILKEPSNLICANHPTSKLVLTAALDKPEFKIWRWDSFRL